MLFRSQVCLSVMFVSLSVCMEKHLCSYVVHILILNSPSLCICRVDSQSFCISHTDMHCSTTSVPLLLSLFPALSLCLSLHLFLSLILSSVCLSISLSLSLYLSFVSFSSISLFLPSAAFIKNHSNPHIYIYTFQFFSILIPSFSFFFYLCSGRSPFQ